jgi:serine/threonine protein phosphatase PrpC
MPEQLLETRSESNGELAEWELQAGLESDVGPVRELNEDYADCVLPKSEEQLRSRGALFVVADGMGGHQAGEVASRWAVERLIHEYYGDSDRDPGSSLVRAVKVANQMIYEHAQADPSKAGMGTTLVAAAVLGRRVYVTNVGDSRAYLINGHGISQITEDHSWVEEQVRAGLMTREQAEQHPQRNLITRALGHKSSVQADLFMGEMHAGDMLLLCSDGLSGRVSGEQMAAIALSQPPPQAAAALVAQAIAQKTDDNVSVLVVKAVDPKQLEGAQARAREQRLRDEDEAPTVVREGRAFGAPVGGAQSWMRELLEKLPPLGKRQKWLVVAVAAVLVLSCLCAALAGFAAVGQVLAGEPVAAPELAPIHYDQLTDDDPTWWTNYLGYDNTDQLHAAIDRWPARRGVFLVGEARDWLCQGQRCTFGLEMSGKEYVIHSDRGFFEKQGADPTGSLLRVYGLQEKDTGPVTARLIDQRRPWWAWWQRAWSPVYDDHNWNETVWVYSVADHEAYSPVRLKDYPGLNEGDRLLLRGQWVDEQGRGAMSFVEEAVYRLEAGRYALLSGVPDPAERPTVTQISP